MADSPRPEALRRVSAIALLVAVGCGAVPLAFAADPADPAGTPADKQEAAETKEEVLQLAPFQVSTTKDKGYAASSSLAGSRLNTELKDVASAIQVVTTEFMKDTGSSNLQDILVFTTNTEVAGIGGNYYGGNADDGGYRARMLVNPQSGTRVRGLNTADLTRNFFSTNIPMDAYNTSRVDIQRGPNSILFGLGSPAGIINNTLKDPNLAKESREMQVRFGSYGSHREVLDVDVPLIRNQLGLRVIGLNDQEKFRQDFTFNDDRRLYAGLRWQPKLAAHVFTQVDLKGESGKISANRPVSVTGADFISNWFGPLNRYLMYTPLTSNGIPQEPNGTQHRELSHYFAGAPGRDWWNDSPGTIFRDPNTAAIGNGALDAYRQRDGSPWGGLSGVTNPNWDEGGTGPWNRNTAAFFANSPVVAKIIGDYQQATGKTFNGFGSSLWPTQMILDGPLAYIDQTMQGPNKKEWNNFDSVDFSVTQTYFGDRLGLNAGYYRENYRSGWANAISSNRVSVDVNATLRDGSANPDVGRPYIVSATSGNMKREDREAWRATAYYKLNFGDFLGRERRLTRILGEHTFTGVVANQRYENFDRYFNLHAWDATSYGVPFLSSYSQKAWWGLHYVGDSLRNVTSFSAIPASAIRPITAIQTPAATSNTLLWDNNTQTWHNASLKLLNWETDLDRLYTGAAQGHDDTKSTSFVWQGKMLNGAIVPLFGWRKDEYERWDKPNSLVRDQYGTPQPYSADWNYSKTKPLTASEQRRSWGVVLHTEPILAMFHQKLPKGISLSLTYNDSNSFRPSEVGTDVYGNKLAAPSGTTRDYGFLLTALDDKVSVRMNWYKTSQKNTTLSDPSGMIYWVKAGVARTMNAMAQETWGSWSPNASQTTPEALVNKWFFGAGYDKTVAGQALPANWRSQLTTLVTQPLRIRHAAAVGDPTYIAEGTINPDTSLPYLAPPLTADEVEYRKAWFAARSDAEWFRPLNSTWVGAEQFAKITGDAYRIWGEGPPAGQKLTNDLVSTGVEIEVTANPTPNWRMTFNAARVAAVRGNILPDWAAFIAENKGLWFDGYNNNAGGPSQLNYWKADGFADIRHWGGTASYSSEQDTFGGRMLQNVYGPYANAIAGTGQAVSELRKWRFNFVTNYTFGGGRFKNVNVGGAVRWQDKTAIGYYPKYNSEAGIWATDVANPIYGPTEANYDAWIGYRRKISERVQWEIQLNVRDAFASDSLVPISANPDGTVAQVRIPSQTTWLVTNTFKF